MASAMGETIGYVNRARAFMPPGTVPPFVTRFDAGSVAVGQLVGEEVPFSLQPGPVATSAVVLVVLGLAGSLVAVRKVTSVDPVIALGAEH